MQTERQFPTVMQNLQLYSYELETGIDTLDGQLQGMQPGEVILICGRPACYDPEADWSKAFCIIEQANRCEYQISPFRWDDKNCRFTD